MKRGVVDPQVLLESANQRKAEADVLAYRAAISKAKVEASVAAAALAVAESETARLEGSPVSFAITAPYDGLIVARNANPLDLAQVPDGPPASVASPPRGPAPLYVVDRIDVVRVFVDIPEPDADYVNIGTKATVLVKAYRDRPIEGTVTRTSWALNTRSRTLRAEIDLPNPDGRLKPGMYAYGKVVLERAGTRALPTAAVTTVDGRSYCWTYDHGRAVRTEIETGLSDSRWIEVIHRRAAPGEGSWAPIDGSEPVILDDLPAIRDGAPVRVDPAARGPEQRPDPVSSAWPRWITSPSTPRSSACASRTYHSDSFFSVSGTNSLFSRPIILSSSIIRFRWDSRAARRSATCGLRSRSAWSRRIDQR